MIIDAKHLYKEETGSFPAVEEEIEISVWRSIDEARELRELAKGNCEYDECDENFV